MTASLLSRCFAVKCKRDHMLYVAQSMNDRYMDGNSNIFYEPSKLFLDVDNYDHVYTDDKGNIDLNNCEQEYVFYVVKVLDNLIGGGVTCPPVIKYYNTNKYIEEIQDNMYSAESNARELGFTEYEIVYVNRLKTMRSNRDSRLYSM